MYIWHQNGNVGRCIVKHNETRKNKRLLKRVHYFVAHSNGVSDVQSAKFTFVHIVVLLLALFMLAKII